MLSAHQLVKSLHGRSVIRDFSLSVRRGEIVGLLGPNGAGKSTTFKMLTGIVAPDAGTIMLDGCNVTDAPFHERARRGLTYLPQASFIPRELTVDDVMMMVLEARLSRPAEQRQERDRLLEDFNLASLRSRRVGTLSGGQRRRCEIAVSLACAPAFALLDEPFAGVDPVNIAEAATLIRAMVDRNIGVLITDHSARDLLGLVDRAYVITDGHVLAEGDAATLVRDPNVRRTYLGGTFQI